jgi:mannose-6-phosphate isomerase-like protein (cupin superfamily)
MIWQANPQYLLVRRGVVRMKKVQIEVEKTWGSELWFANTKEYCGKLLIVEPDKWSSEGKFHYHENKDETFFIIEGILWLDIADEEGGHERLTIHTNDSYRVMPGVKHRFSSATSNVCKFIEASTHHEDSDSYRCSYNKKEGDWIYG